MKSTGWISFRNKLPYSAIEGRLPAYDFPILIVSHVGENVIYETSTAMHATHMYTEHHALYIAWRPIEEYDGPLS